MYIYIYIYHGKVMLCFISRVSKLKLLLFSSCAPYLIVCAVYLVVMTLQEIILKSFVAILLSHAKNYIAHAVIQDDCCVLQMIQQSINNLVTVPFAGGYCLSKFVVAVQVLMYSLQLLLHSQLVVEFYMVFGYLKAVIIKSAPSHFI